MSMTKHETIELFVIAGIAVLFEIAAIAGFLIALLVWGTVPWL